MKSSVIPHLMEQKLDADGGESLIQWSSFSNHFPGSCSIVHEMLSSMSACHLLRTFEKRMYFLLLSGSSGTMLLKEKPNKPNSLTYDGSDK